MGDEWLNEQFGRVIEAINKHSALVESGNQDRLEQFAEAKAEGKNLLDAFEKEHFEDKEESKELFDTIAELKQLIAKYEESIHFAMGSVDYFVGRDEELKEIRENFKKTRRMVITGLGGIGKTSLARKYAHNNEDNFKNLIWLEAENRTILQEKITSLAKNKLKISTENEVGEQMDMESIFSDVYVKLDKKKSLVIFNNAQEYKDIASYLPQQDLYTNVSIIATSRNQEWELIPTFNLPVFSPKDAIMLIETILDQESKAEENQLAEKLHYFPLALKHACMCIKETGKKKRNVGSNFNINDYLCKFKEHTKISLDLKPKYTSDIYKDTTFTTWTITINKINEDKSIGKLASKFLDMLGYMSSDNIPVKMFLSADTFKSDLEDVVDLVKNFSMVSSEDKPELISIHRLVQEVIRINIKDEKNGEEILRELLSIISQALENEEESVAIHAMSVWEHSRSFPNLVRDFVYIPSRILNYLIEKGKYREGEPFGGKSLQDLEKMFPRDLKEILSLTFARADLLNYMGKYDDAFQMWEEVMKKRIDLLGVDHPEVLSTMHSMAIAIYNKGKYDEALQMYEKVLKKRIPLLGEDHPDVLCTMSNMASPLNKKGKYDEAFQMYEKVLKKRIPLLGEEHPDVLRTMHDMASTLDDKGKYDEALQMYEKVLKKRIPLLGEDHPSVLDPMHNMAVALYNKGKYDEAFQMYEKVLKKRIPLLGEDHPDVLRTKRIIDFLIEIMSLSA